MVRRSTLFLFAITSFSMVGALSVAPKGGTAHAQSTSVLIAQADSDLYVGLRDAAVEMLQTQLKEQGFYDGPLDGVFGLSTQRAVMAFQAEAGIAATGRWDEASRQALAMVLTSSDAEDIATSESLEDESVTDETADAIALIPTTAEPKTNRLTQLLMIGLGLSAVAGSFGIWSLVASRRKKELDYPTVENELAIDEDTASPSDSNAPIADPTNHSSYQPSQTSHTRALNEANGGLAKTLHTLDSKGRRAAIWELGQYGHSLAVQPLVDLMIEVDSKEKSLILAALSEIGMRSLRPLSHALANALQDDNPEVRKNAIRDLSRIYDLVVQVSQLLGRAIEDEDADVRQTARWAIEQLGRIRHLQDSEPDAEPDGRTVLNAATPMAANTMTANTMTANTMTANTMTANTMTANTVEFETSNFANQRH